MEHRQPSAGEAGSGEFEAPLSSPAASHYLRINRDTLTVMMKNNYDFNRFRVHWSSRM